ncbi:MAG TPA: hypothetical protein VNF74_15120 [Terriglobales bacterium]|nr:hypothetical protein [Terriglobales bacterium]
MIHQVLLVSRDAALAARIRRALPARIPLELLCESRYRPAADLRGWLLVLLDARAGATALAAATAPASEPGPPLLWLGEGPVLTAAATERRLGPRPIVDFLQRELPPSKLAFILHQHLTAAYLQRMRGLPASPLTALLAAAGREELEGQINNTLTGLLGNAQLASRLALDAGRRLPAPLALRLVRICDLAAQMRDLLLAYPHAKSPLP